MFAQKTAIVTGGNRGVGLELTRQLLRKGSSVVATTRSRSRAAELEQLAAENSGRLTITELDVDSPASVEAWAAGLKKGFKHFDLVINNAGALKRVGFSDVTSQDMLGLFVTNAIGPLLVAQQLHRQGLIGAPGSLVANVTSKMGSIDDNTSGGSYAYRASKAALNIVSKSMSIDLLPEGITTVLLHPGWVKTGMTNYNGLIDAETCAAGLLEVLESGLAGKRKLNGRWYDYAGKELPW